MAFQQIKAQDARGVFRESMLHDPRYIGEEKYDGERRIAQFVEGRVRFTGKRPGVDGNFVEKTENVPHLNTFIASSGLDGTILDGEMCLPVGHSYPIKEGQPQSKIVTSVMGCTIPGRAEAKQKAHGWLTYRVFDCLQYGSVDLREHPLEVRKAYIPLILSIWNKPSAQVVPYYSSISQLIEEMRLSKKEGVIVKWLDAPYGEKKHWCKIKFEWTADTVVMGFDPPEEWSTKSDGTISRTEFFLNGWIGAIRCGQYVNGVLTECASVSGFPKDLREAMSRLPKFYVGKVLRIKHYGKEPTGRFRHPQFGDFRTDKDPKDCIQDLNEI